MLGARAFDRISFWRVARIAIRPGFSSEYCGELGAGPSVMVR